MDLLHIFVRVVFGYLFVFAVIRASGKRTISQSDPHSFVFAVILGDLFDDLFWAEVSASEFIVAVGTLVLLQVLAGLGMASAAHRIWKHSPHRSAA